MQALAGKLYVVATPIGNLKDITYRAVEVLKAVDLIACEDTRHARILLDYYGIDRPLTSLFQGNESAKAASLIDRIIEGGSIALISDAGTPNISDPGYRLVEACVKRGVEAVSVPGPSAVVAAMSVSGLPTDAFIFEGFLPVKSGARRNRMESWKSERRTVIFYESPHRIARTLEDIRTVFGEVPVVIARELTKKFEEVLRLPVGEMITHFAGKKPLGEFTVLLNLRGPKRDEKDEEPDDG